MTVLSGLAGVERWIVAVIAGLAALSIALLSATNAQELWVRSRGIQQELQVEKFLYLAGAGEYSGLPAEEGVRRFSDRVIMVWSAGHQRWQQAVQERSDHSDGRTAGSQGG